MKTGNNLKNIPNASDVLKRKNNNRMDAFPKSLFDTFKEYENPVKDFMRPEEGVVALYKEILNRLNKVFGISSDEFDKEIYTIEYNSGGTHGTITLKDVPETITLEGKVIKVKINNKTYYIDGVRAESFINDENDKFSFTTLSELARVVDIFLENKEKCTIKKYKKG